VIARTAVAEAIYRSCLYLDDRDFEAYLGLCDPEFHYTIQAYSPEIRRDMVWLEHDKAGLETLFRNLPRHNSDHAPLTRHATVYTVVIDELNGRGAAVSALQVVRTALDGGASELFAVGKLYDTLKVTGDRAALLKRTVKLDTRMLGIGSHIPF
jgi:methanesulfonate monooxygenase small subunit